MYLLWKLDVVFEGKNPNHAHWSAVLVSQPSSHDWSQHVLAMGSCSGVRKVLLFSSAAWQKQQPGPGPLPAHQGKQCGIPSSAPPQCVPAACSSCRGGVSMIHTECRSSRLPCFPPPRFPLFSVSVCLLSKVMLNPSSCPHALRTRLNCFLYF